MLTGWTNKCQHPIQMPQLQRSTTIADVPQQQHSGALKSARSSSSLSGTSSNQPLASPPPHQGHHKNGGVNNNNAAASATKCNRSGSTGSGKRNSGLFAFWRWLRSSSSRDSISTTSSGSGSGSGASSFSASSSRQNVNSACANSGSSSGSANNTPRRRSSVSGSTSSLCSTASTGTVASFSYVAPAAYRRSTSGRCIAAGPETDTYRARLRERDERRTADKDVTLRQKYNLFFGRSARRNSNSHKQGQRSTEDLDINIGTNASCKSLPLMAPHRSGAGAEDEDDAPPHEHRRTNSESSRSKKAGAYVHVKGKRRAPPPPIKVCSVSAGNTLSWRRRKRVAPAPPPTAPPTESPDGAKAAPSLTDDTIVYADADILYNDSLRLDNGFLKSIKGDSTSLTPSVSKSASPGSVALMVGTSSAQSAALAPVSPRPWYKRNSINASAKLKETENKYEPISTAKSDQDASKRKSGMSYLANISELDREAAAIMAQKEPMAAADGAMPEFMRLKINANTNALINNSNNNNNNNNSAQASSSVAANNQCPAPKRKSSARDLIAKFNAITTNVSSRVTVFGSKNNNQQELASRYFGRAMSTEAPRTVYEEDHNDADGNGDDDDVVQLRHRNPLVKSESASAMGKRSNKQALKDGGSPLRIKHRAWHCPKCKLENDYWRIICAVCSTIKPYFDDFMPKNGDARDPSSSSKEELSSDAHSSKEAINHDTNRLTAGFVLERSKTQIGFSVLANYNKPGASAETSKHEEREKLKKMLIEMKNSLPKRRSSGAPQASALVQRRSTIDEQPEAVQIAREESKPIIPEVIVKDGDEIKARPTEVRINAERKKSIPQKELPKSTEPPKSIDIIIATKRTIYDEIKVPKTTDSKPLDKPFKVSSSAQTNAVARAPVKDAEKAAVNYAFELIRPKDLQNKHANETAVQNETPSAIVKPSDKIVTDTLEINRLLRKLETSISRGELTQASIYARDLAQLKVNCSVVRQRPNCESGQSQVNGASASRDSVSLRVNLYIEERTSKRGPFPIRVRAGDSLFNLKLQIAKDFNFPVNVQRWLLGNQLALSDTKLLQDYGVREDSSLYLTILSQSYDSRSPSKEQLKLSLNDKSKIIAASKITIPSTKVEVDVVTKPVFNLQDAILKPSSSKPTIVNVKLKTSTTANDVKSPETPLVITPNSGNDTPPPTTKTPLNNKGLQNDFKQPPLVINHKIKPMAPIAPNKVAEIKLIKPKIAAPTEWSCRICTLLNPHTANICGVCANVRITDPVLEAANFPVKPIRFTRKSESEPKKHYQELMNLDQTDVVTNAEAFECMVCFQNIESQKGVTLRECLHQFCKDCLAFTVQYCEEAEVKCPYRDNDYACDMVLQAREIRALVPRTVYEAHLARSVAHAENRPTKTGSRSFHCKTADCKGWCVYEDNVNEFRCPVCRKQNCLTCQAIHDGINCKQYQERLNAELEAADVADSGAGRRTREMLADWLDRGDALHCPACQVLLMKKWGCDWVRCTMCKTEICWVTRGPRWGPGGKGDTSAGCRCGVNGVKCHAQCNYCH